MEGRVCAFSEVLAQVLVVKQKGSFKFACSAAHAIVRDMRSAPALVRGALFDASLRPVISMNV